MTFCTSSKPQEAQQDQGLHISAAQPASCGADMPLPAPFNGTIVSDYTFENIYELRAVTCSRWD